MVGWVMVSVTVAVSPVVIRPVARAPSNLAVNIELDDIVVARRATRKATDTGVMSGTKVDTGLGGVGGISLHIPRLGHGNSRADQMSTGRPWVAKVIVAVVAGRQGQLLDRVISLRMVKVSL